MAGFIIAIAAGWLVHDARKAAATVIVPWLGVLAIVRLLAAEGVLQAGPAACLHSVQE